MHYGILRVKIEVAEVGEIAKTVEIADANAPPRPCDGPRALQFLQRSVDMHGGEAEQVGELFLRDRKVAFDQIRGADRKAVMDFADEVGEPGERVAPSDVEQPFAADRRFDQYVGDDRPRERRTHHDQPLDLPVGNDRQFDRVERLNRVVGLGEKKRLEI